MGLLLLTSDSRREALLRPRLGQPSGREGGHEGGSAAHSPQLPLVELAVLRLHLVDLLLEPPDLHGDRDGSHLCHLTLLHESRTLTESSAPVCSAPCCDQLRSADLISDN